MKALRGVGRRETGAVDSHRRSLSKALSWRVFAVFITTGVAFALTGKLVFAATVGVADSLVKIFVYYLHERAWAAVPTGRLSSRSTGSSGEPPEPPT